MKNASGRPGFSEGYAEQLAVVTGGASGMGRELVIQLAERGCSVAACDLDSQGLGETLKIAAVRAPPGVALSAHVCDVADRGSVDGFRDRVAARHATDHVDLLFNNAGVHGEDSFVDGDRANWERVFSVCWNAVYLPTRAFLPMLMASRSAWLINTGSVNSFLARHGDGAPCTAYSAAKFAVRGFSEALIEDLRTNAPQVRVAIAFPGTVVTQLGANSNRILGRDLEPAVDGDAGIAAYLEGLGVSPADLAEDDLSRIGDLLRAVFMLPAESAVRQILEAIQEGRWRILVGEDSTDVDELVRAHPDTAYDQGAISQVNRDLLGGLVSLVARTQSVHIRHMDFTFDLTVGRYHLMGRASGGSVRVERWDDSAAGTAAVVCGPETFRRVMSGAESLAQAVHDGRLSVHGDRARFEQLLNAVRPEPISISGA